MWNNKGTGRPVCLGKRIREGSVLLRLLYSCSSAGHALLIEGYAQTSTKLSRDPKVSPPPQTCSILMKQQRHVNRIVIPNCLGGSLLLFLSLYFGQGLDWPQAYDPLSSASQVPWWWCEPPFLASRLLVNKWGCSRSRPTDWEMEIFSLYRS